MPQYTQEMFDIELNKMIETAKKGKNLPLTVTAQEVHDRVIPHGTKDKDGKLVSRWTSACSAMRMRADIEIPVNGKRRGECLNTTDSGNSPTVKYKYSS